MAAPASRFDFNQQLRIEGQVISQGRCLCGLGGVRLGGFLNLRSTGIGGGCNPVAPSAGALGDGGALRCGKGLFLGGTGA